MGSDRKRGFDVRQIAAALLAGAAIATASAARDTVAGPRSDAAITARAQALVERMTAEEKAGQIADWFYIAQLPPIAQPVAEAVATGRAGAVLFVSDAKTANALQHAAVERTRLHIPLLLGFDVIHGLRTIMPVPLALAASWDPATVEQADAVAAAEARAVGIHWAFAPNVDIARDPRWGRIVEGAGEDPYLGSAMARAHVRGLQGSAIGATGHVIAGAKHFAGYGASIGGRDYDEAQVSDSDLWNVYLPPFEAAIDAGAGNIMSAYMPLNGVPAAANGWLLTDVLRKDWGFKGFVVSDANAVNALQTQDFASDGVDAAARALNAGLDMEMVAPTMKPVTAMLPAAVAAGRVSRARLDEAVRRILEAKIRMGLFENPYVDEAAAARTLANPAHLAVARRAAARSAVLLRNEGGVLPLDRTRLRSVALIGPLADAGRDMLGSWVFPQNDPPSTTVLAALRERLGSGVRVDYQEGARLPVRTVPSPFDMGEKPVDRPPLDGDDAIRRAVASTRGADVAVLALGEGQNMSGETASRSSLDLPGRQQELLDAVIATGKPVIVLLFSARPLDLKGAKPGAILDMWYPGSAGGQAAADLLLGDSVPGGHLPITWVDGIGSIPNPYAQLPPIAPKEADRRYWNQASSAPTYPFGFGLSYTTFAYSNLRIASTTVAPDEPITLSVDLTNTGSRTGDEVAQLYIHQRYGSSARPVRELKGFERVTLEPGQTRTLSFTLTPQDRCYWSATTRGWENDAMQVDLWVGGSSHAELGGSVQVSRRPNAVPGQGRQGCRAIASRR